MNKADIIMLKYVGEGAYFIRFSPCVLESVDFIVISLSFSLICTNNIIRSCQNFRLKDPPFSLSPNIGEVHILSFHNL